MLALASLLVRAARRPGHARQALPADRAAATPSQLPAVRGAPRRAAPPRRATSSSARRLLPARRSRVRLIGYPGDHTRFEAPPLASGRRLRGRRRGRGRARARRRARAAARLDARGPAAPAAARSGCASSGVVRALENRGARRLRPRRAAAAPPSPGSQPTIAIRLTAGRRPGARRRRADARSARAPTRVGGATTQQRAVPRRARRACCAASGSRSGSSACTRWSRRSRSPRASAAARSRCCGPPAPTGATVALRARRRRARRRRARRARRGRARARGARAAGRAARRRLRRRSTLAPTRRAGRCSWSPACSRWRAAATRLVARRADARADRRRAAGGVMRAALAACLRRRRPRRRLRRRTARRPAAGLDARRDARRPRRRRRARARPGRAAARPRPSSAAAAGPGATLATFAQITDAHVRDEESPARVPFLDRLGGVFSPTFRPQEALTTQVLAASVARAQPRCARRPWWSPATSPTTPRRNELDAARAVLDGGRVRPRLRRARLHGRAGGRTTPTPSTTAPTTTRRATPGCSTRRSAPFARARPRRAAGTRCSATTTCSPRARLPPTPAIDAVATGDRMVESLDPGLRPDPGTDPTAAVAALLGGRPARPHRARSPADPARAPADPAEALRRLGRRGRDGGRLDYTFDVGASVRGIVLDVVNRAGGARGVVTPAQLAWLRAALPARGRRYVVVFSHQPLRASDGGEAALRALDAAPRVVAAIAGHRHRNAIAPAAPRARLLADRDRVARRLPAAGALLPPASRPPAAASRSRRGWSTRTARASPASRASSRSSTRRAAGRRASPGARRTATPGCGCRRRPCNAALTAGRQPDGGFRRSIRHSGAFGPSRSP